ncbi:MAG: zinc ribbon domain-containing protein [Chloroflexota bacterium]|nr:zinc ribbon domain-containing protein [Chloroflexota bacterium]
MPLYDYRCAQCGNTFEARHGFNDDAPACSVCGTPQPERIITTVPSIHKGIGADAGSGGVASKDQLQAKWAEETPRLREKLVSKLGEDTVNKYAPTLNKKYE